MTLNVRLASAILLVATLPLMLLSMVLYASHRGDITRATEEHLRAEAAMQTARVAAVLDRDAERLAMICGRTDLRQHLAAHVATRDRVSRRQLNRILADAAGAAAAIEGIAAYDLGGVAVAATDTTLIGHGHPERTLFDRARRRPVVGHVQRDAAGRSHVAVAGPVVREGAAIGVVVIQASAAALHRALADTSGRGENGPGETGETVLAQPLGGDRWRFLAPTRFRPDATFAEFTSACAALPASRTLAGDEDGSLCVDYRGQPVLAASQPVPGTDWSLVVKMDHAEVLAPLHRTMLWVLGLGSILCAAIVTATLHFCRRLSPPLAELATAAGGVGARRDAGGGGDLGLERHRSGPAPSAVPTDADALAARLDTMAIQVAAAHAAGEQNARRLEAEIARRRAVEAECETLATELARVRDQIRSGLCPGCGARHQQPTGRARRGEVRE